MRPICFAALLTLSIPALAEFPSATCTGLVTTRDATGAPIGIIHSTLTYTASTGGTANATLAYSTGGKLTGTLSYGKPGEGLILNVSSTSSTTGLVVTAFGSVKYLSQQGTHGLVFEGTTTSEPKTLSETGIFECEPAK